MPGQGGCALRTFAHTWAMRRVLKSFARVLCWWGDDRERVDSEKIGSRQDRWCSKEQGTVLRTLVQIPPVQGGRKQGDREEKKESWGPPLASAKEKDSDLHSTGKFTPGLHTYASMPT